MALTRPALYFLKRFETSAWTVDLDDQHTNLRLRARRLCAIGVEDCAISSQHDRNATRPKTTGSPAIGKGGGRRGERALVVCLANNRADQPHGVNIIPSCLQQ